MLVNKSFNAASGAGGLSNNQSSSAQHQSRQGKKFSNKSFENLGAKLKLQGKEGLLVDLQLQNPKSAVSYHTHRSNKGGKNSTLSTSPKRRDGSQTTTGLGSSANY